MQGGEQLSIWHVLIVLVFPVIAAGFWLLWERVKEMEQIRSASNSELWQHIGKIQEGVYHVERRSEERYVHKEELDRIYAALREYRQALDDHQKYILHQLDEIRRLLVGRAHGVEPGGKR